MDKVLVERPRLGGHGERKGRTPCDPDLLPKAKGMKRGAKERNGYKQLNENLAPLRRFLHSQVDRPWDKVHSEISERIDGGNTVQAHILLHIDDFVARQVVKVEPSEASPCGVDRKPGTRRSWRQPLQAGELYVDPDDGLLRKARRRLKGEAPKRAPKAGDVIKLSGERILHKYCGAWHMARLHPYRLTEADHPDDPSLKLLAFEVAGRISLDWTDGFEGRILASDTRMLTRIARLYGPKRLAGARRLLSARELQEHGLV